MPSLLVLFLSGAAAYNGAAFSRIAGSRVTRSSPVEMAKKSVGDLTEADLKGKKVSCAAT